MISVHKNLEILAVAILHVKN